MQAEVTFQRTPGTQHHDAPDAVAATIAYAH